MEIVFFLLLTSHLIGDFPLQTNGVVQLKNRGGWGIIPHVLIHVGFTALLIQNPFSQWAMLLTLGGAHYLIDWTKLTFSKSGKQRDFWLDQLGHLLTIIALTFLFPTISLAIPLGSLVALFVLAIVAAGSIYLAIFPTPLDELLEAIPPQTMFNIAKILGGAALIILVLL